MKNALRRIVDGGISRRGTQHGVAAIEFSLIAICMIVMLLGLLVWWRYFQTSQILNKAAGDGARAAHSLVVAGTWPCLVANADANRMKILTRVHNVIASQIMHSGLTAARLGVSKPQWTCSSTGAGSFKFDVDYQLPAIPEVDHWVKEPLNVNLNDRVVVHFPAPI